MTESQHDHPGPEWVECPGHYYHPVLDCRVWSADYFGNYIHDSPHLPTRLMSYRPITDTWFLARAKLRGGRKYYGAYLGGFPERARALLGVRIDQPVLHVCGGMAKHYPYRGGFGPADKTLDLDPQCEPDFQQDAGSGPYPSGFAAMLCDPPYSEADAAHYAVGASAYPKPNAIIKHALDALPAGGRVGIIHYILPSPPKGSRFVAAVGIMCGFNNRIRIYSVFEKPYGG